MVTGQGTSVQIGKETTWGTAVTPTAAINYTSEGFKLVVDRTEEDSLIGAATTRGMDIQKKSVQFDLSLLAKPENIGLLIGMALGSEASPVAVTGASGAYSHAFTPISAGVSSSLPKFTAVVDRHVAIKKYTGNKVDSMTINCQAGDYMRIDFSGRGKDEDTGSLASLSIPDLKAFRFAGGSVTFDGVEFGDVTGVQFNYNNALDDGEQTTGSGYYGTENEPQKREITVSIDTFYNTASETVREGKYKTESTVAVVLKFDSPSLAYDADSDDEEDDGDVHYSIEISMPLVVVTSCDPNVSGPEKLRLTNSGTATESTGTDAVTITLVDKKNTKYLA